VANIDQIESAKRFLTMNGRDMNLSTRSSRTARTFDVRPHPAISGYSSGPILRPLAPQVVTCLGPHCGASGSSWGVGAASGMSEPLAQWASAGDNSIDRIPENRLKIFVYLLMVLGPGTPAYVGSDWLTLLVCRATPSASRHCGVGKFAHLGRRLVRNLILPLDLLSVGSSSSTQW